MSVITVLLPLISDKSLFAYLKEKRKEGKIFTEIRGEWWGHLDIDREYKIELVGREHKRAHLVSDESLEKAAKYIEDCEVKLWASVKNKAFRFHYKALEKSREQT